MYSESVTSLPSPFGRAKSGALSPSFKVVDFPAAPGGGSFGGLSGDDCCAYAEVVSARNPMLMRSRFIVRVESNLRDERLSNATLDLAGV